MLDVAAAAAAKSLQSCPTLCNPKDGSPPGSSIPTRWEVISHCGFDVHFSND